ncbi:MAG: glycoside hydrolase family 2 TIM barrel-domain containing protein [Oscillospiraceae bacterium]|nr:glycoside hydrolase family 2 TIM barrel-domain containing protein [Oscillospiraceae bacterium]
MELNHQYYIEPREKNHIELCDEWSYTYTDKPVDDIAELEWNLKTQIPNSIYWSLYESEVLPHPYVGCNSRLFSWVDEKVWYYQKRFSLDDSFNIGDAFLCADGVAYYSRVWLNGALLGSHEGMFGGPIINVADRLNYNGENEVVIEVKACNYGIKDRWSPRNHKGENTAIVPWNIVRDKDSSTGDFIVIGLWRGVRIEFLPKLHISRPYLTTKSIEGNSAVLHLDMEIADGTINELESDPGYASGCYGYTRAFDVGITGVKQKEPVDICVEIREKLTNIRVYYNQTQIQLYDREKSFINPKYYECQFYNTDIVIENPKLWFPVNMGEAFLYNVTITLLKGNRVYDTHSFDYGIRTICLENTAGDKFRSRWGKFQFIINGKPIFLKGMNWAPIDYLYKFKSEEYRWNLELVKNAGIQLLRVWSGGGIPENDDFYRICDELGIMVWQDSFIANMETPNWPQDILEQQVSMNIYRIRNHPSLAVHCGGNEFNPYSFGNAASMFVIQRSIEDLDYSRPFIRTTADMGSAHIYKDFEPVWYRKAYKQLPFVGETGIHSFPNFKTIKQLISEKELSILQEHMPDLSNPVVKEKYPELINHFSEYVPSRVPRMVNRTSHINDIDNISLEDFIEATNIASGEFYQIMLESMRENFPVTSGIMPWVFKRPWTTVAIQLVDGMGLPVAPYYYVLNSYRPLSVMVCLEQLSFAPEEVINLPVAIINDSGNKLEGVMLKLEILDPEFKTVYKKTENVEMSSEQYKKHFHFQDFEIPGWFTEKYFFIHVALIKDDIMLGQSFYWPRCLKCLEDKAFCTEFRSRPHENLRFTEGPYLKPQIAAVASGALLGCRVLSVERKSIRTELNIQIKNNSDVPAFPISISLANSNAPFYTSDNYYFQSSRQTRDIKMVIYDEDHTLNSFDIEISAWNSNKESIKVES